MKIFQNLNFVLVETSHPGNIGACARAMNSMGICNLSLVNPKEFPSKESEARAKSGRKVLDQANIYDCLLYTSPSPRDLSTSRMPSSA